jgi:hypothetical protein
MSMKACSECKKQISADANPCPHCGKKNPHGTSKGAAVIGTIVALAGAYWLHSSFTKLCGRSARSRSGQLQQLTER